MCSRLRNGSAATPTSERRPEAVAEILSRCASGSWAAAPSGAPNERRIETGRPAELPGV